MLMLAPVGLRMIANVCGQRSFIVYCVCKEHDICVFFVEESILEDIAFERLGMQECTVGNMFVKASPSCPTSLSSLFFLATW